MTFTRGTLSAFAPFQALDVTIQGTLLQLVSEDRLNDYGGLKRPPNVWLVFRSEVFAKMDNKRISQSELTAISKVAWEQITPEQKAELKKRADAKHANLLMIFPEYHYRPMNAGEKAMWTRMESALRKKFWLASAVSIAERIVSPNGKWSGPLSLTNWARLHLATEEYARLTDTPVAVLLGRPTGPASVGLSSLALTPGVDPCAVSEHSLGYARQRAPTHPRQSPRFTPYGPARERPSTQGSSSRSAQLNPPPEWLESSLLPLGPMKDGGKRRRLVMSTFQEQDRAIWVEEEVDDSVPEANFLKLTECAPRDTFTDVLILRNFANSRIPKALDEDGNLYSPLLRSIPELRAYLKTHRAAESSGSPFVWLFKPVQQDPGHNTHNTRGDDTSNVAAQSSVGTPIGPSEGTPDPVDNGEDFQRIIDGLEAPIDPNDPAARDIYQQAGPFNHTCTPRINPADPNTFVQSVYGNHTIDHSSEYQDAQYFSSGSTSVATEKEMPSSIESTRFL